METPHDKGSGRIQTRAFSRWGEGANHYAIPYLIL